ncbi:MAG TPA: aldo/keto reductase [Jatrophihabitans sp.]|jgi:aryl-alcohol dehydrogenase (NADP+)
MTRIENTDLDVFPLCFGGNVFGWTADEQQSFTLMDAYAAAGGNFIDTADVYSAWASGNSGGESEVIIGNWMAARGNRGDVVVATKVGWAPDFKGLSAKNIREAADASLKRMQTDYIDLYYAHYDDQDVPLEETLTALDGLVQEGKVRYLAASNYTAPRLAEALEISKRDGLARYVALQPRFNLIDRERYSTELADLVAAEGIACLPYLALADGFLTGKYRANGGQVDTGRAEKALAHVNEGSLAALDVLTEVAAAHNAPVAAAALAWLAAQPSVVAPIASARTTTQLAELLTMAELRLSVEELNRLNDVSAR